MSSIWLKIAGVAVVAVVVIVVLGRFGGDKPAPTPPEKDKTFYDMADRDKQFAEAPKPAEEATPEPTPQPPAQEAQAAPAEQPPAEAPAQPAQPEAAQAPGADLPSSITKPTTLYFKPLDETEDVAAQQLLPWAATSRSIGRLPMMQYGPMVKACRDILQRWPESTYAFRAKQMLEEIYERHGAQYKITPQEMDISKFRKPRRGTQPVTVEPVQR